MTRRTRFNIMACVLLGVFGVKAGYYSAVRVWQVDWWPWSIPFMILYGGFGIGVFLLANRENRNG